MPCHAAHSAQVCRTRPVSAPNTGQAGVGHSRLSVPAKFGTSPCDRGTTAAHSNKTTCAGAAHICGPNRRRSRPTCRPRRRSSRSSRRHPSRFFRTRPTRASRMHPGTPFCARACAQHSGQSGGFAAAALRVLPAGTRGRRSRSRWRSSIQCSTGASGAARPYTRCVPTRSEAPNRRSLHVCACVRACVRACVACACACATVPRACVWARMCVVRRLIDYECVVASAVRSVTGDVAPGPCSAITVAVAPLAPKSDWRE